MTYALSQPKYRNLIEMRANISSKITALRKNRIHFSRLSRHQTKIPQLIKLNKLNAVDCFIDSSRRVNYIFAGENSVTSNPHQSRQ